MEGKYEMEIFEVEQEEYDIVEDYFSYSSYFFNYRIWLRLT